MSQNPEIHTLSNGLNVVLSHNPNIRTVQTAFFINVGSNIENLKNSGICHFLEHMIFKGTKTRTANDISKTIEENGGYINAWTSKEKTCFYTKMLFNDVNISIDILSDIILNSTFEEKELIKEKSVVKEEIDQSQDDPEDLVYELFMQNTYKNYSLGLPILGTKNNVSSFTNKDLSNLIQDYYTASNMVVCICGNLKDKEAILAKLESSLKSLPTKNIENKHKEAIFQPSVNTLVKKELNQAQIIYGFNYPNYYADNKDFFTAKLINVILGVGMSSRLFQEIREKQGLVYSIDSTYATYHNTGFLAIQAGCNVDSLPKINHSINQEILKLQTDKITEAEINKAKKLMVSSLYMSLENLYSTTERLAISYLNHGKIESIDNIVENINNITAENILNFSQKNHSKKSISIVANKDINLDII
jgi:predicted Zn-dependent peptidase